MESLAALVTVLLIIGLFGGPVAMLLAAMINRGDGGVEAHGGNLANRAAKIVFGKAAVAALALLSIVVNAMFLIGRVPGVLRILSFIALCTGLIAIKRLYFQSLGKSE